MFNILIDIINNFHSFNIRELFEDVKIYYGLFGKIQKHRHKTGTQFTPQL